MCIEVPLQLGTAKKEKEKKKKRKKNEKKNKGGGGVPTHRVHRRWCAWVDSTRALCQCTVVGVGGGLTPPFLVGGVTHPSIEGVDGPTHAHQWRAWVAPTGQHPPLCVLFFFFLKIKIIFLIYYYYYYFAMCQAQVANLCMWSYFIGFDIVLCLHWHNFY
jgi:hypothetical protein